MSCSTRQLITQNALRSSFSENTCLSKGACLKGCSSVSSTKIKLKNYQNLKGRTVLYSEGQEFACKKRFFEKNYEGKNVIFNVKK